MLPTGLTCIVDDDADYRLIIQILFKRSFPQYANRFFSGGQDLLDALPQMNQLPNLILLDRHMPELDGHQTLVLLKQHQAYKQIPVVMMSAGPSAQEIDGCYESGANSFLLKNLDAVSLKDALSAICVYWLELNLASSKN